MDGLIRYGMGDAYLPDWGVKEALRELYQNFEDYGDYCVNSTVIPCAREEKVVHLSMVNDFSPGNHGFMKIGESGKRNDPSTVGKHGEGLKLASMVLVRQGYTANIRYGCVSLKGVFYDDDYLGRCFGFEVQGASPVDGFRVDVTVPSVEFERYQVVKLKPEDVIYSNSYGELLNRPTGEVYVGGHFVAKVEGLTYAYNFNPEHIDLDRDRRIPRDFDVQWAASHILQGWKGLKVKDVKTKDGAYMTRLPTKVANKFRPYLSGKKVCFKAGSVQATGQVTDQLMKMPINQKRIAKLKYSMSKKRTPHSTLKEFFDQHSRSMSADCQTDFLVILKKSKEWK